ncbi:MAG: Rne/Rng family ribonuclease [Acidobacteriota bacterium]|nr:MAG: Rne/Rng family ribonuclease [Acidobacteriota bacterium]
MSKELIVSVNGREKKIAIVEDDVVTEFYVERGDENQGIVGNIYKGRVMKVLPGMQSAFVDIGLERDSFLYVSDFFDEEEMEEITVSEKEERKGRQPRPERARAARGARAAVVPAEVEEEKDIDLEVAALSHIEELAEEPVPEPAEDDEMVDLGTGEKVRGRAKSGREAAGTRQRRQRRLQYTEPEEEAAVVEEEVVVEGLEEAEEAEPSTRGRRRRPRRRRTEEAPIAAEGAPEEGEEAGEEEAAVEGVEVGFLEHHILVHHEPLERITDEDALDLDGEMLKDAILQERIRGRIQDEEIHESVLEVEPTPEVLVGSLAMLEGENGLERISDDAGEIEEFEIPVAIDEDEEEEPDVETDEFEEVEVLHLQPHDEPASDEENGESADLEDASAEIRQRNKRGDFAATRRGGRGRRRGFRQKTDQAAAPEAEAEKPAGEAEAEPATPAPAKSTERYQRPIISDLLREGQEIIVQIAKEPIGQKGARITSHIALPGRYIVYMPTVEHIGVSRKIGTDDERMRLKKTLHQLRAEAGISGGFIVRTAANGCPLEDLREDMQYLIRTWTDIRRRAERAKAPAIAHRDLDLVQRILRDQLSSDFTAIRVDNEFEYERIVDFVNRFAPKLVNRVKLYTKDVPILEHYGIQSEIDKAVKPRVWLKSGGYIVINQTEALVAIDVNTGKFVGKSNRLEDTIVKTNLEAAKEIVRQIRLRDLGGIIVLDFIDMEERRNRHKVMQALEQELKSDRSPSKILQFNDFGLVAITRKRVKQSLERTLCTPCHYCGGGGMVKSAQTICYEILSESRRVSKEIDSHNEVILRVNPEVAKALRSTERDIMNEIEAHLGGVVTIKSDPTVHQEQFDIAVA